MKTPRITDFDPDAKVPALKSPLDGMPAIGKPQPRTKDESENKQQGDPSPVPDGVPVGERVGVPPPVPLIPKVKRLIRQRQPFDIYEDQYQRLKQIAEAEKGFVNGRGMSHMVREAIDNYLKDHGTPRE